MAVGKYRSKHTWYDSKEWGVHEELLKEGVANGRGWAVLRRWRPNPRYSWERGESYVLRVDISEFFGAYTKCAIGEDGVYRILDKIGKDLGDIKRARVRIANCSPGWWENGFGQQLCLELTMFRYESDADKFEKIVKTGRDWDTVDYAVAVVMICQGLEPLFRLFIETCGKPPCQPKDDF